MHFAHYVIYSKVVPFYEKKTDIRMDAGPATVLA
jgi:hypothetical protein